MVRPDAGAVASFSGVTRCHFEGRTVRELQYEAYDAMAEAELRKLCSEVRSKWHVKAIAVVHRTGTVPIGEPSVEIAISSEHRKDGLEAVAFFIDELKARVPIWKKEVYAEDEGAPGGDSPHAVWKANAE